MANDVSLTNDLIDVLLANSSVVALVPCLQQARQVAEPGCCTGGGGAVVLDYQAIKDCIALTDSSSVQIIRHALRADSLVVYRQTTRNGRRVTVKHKRT